jgi:hypothetical protein
MCAFAQHWRRAQQRADDAQGEYELIVNDAIGSPRTCRLWLPAARNWCLAKCDVPFADTAKACRLYLHDLSLIGERIPLEESTAAAVQEDLTQFREYTREADGWLAAGSASGEPKSTTEPE